MKNNYPIRYVALPLTEDGRWRNDSEDVRGVICYLVIKCYVVGEETKYFREGDSVTTYKVVPTYGTLSSPTIFYNSEPKYYEESVLFDYKNIEYTTYYYTENVFKDRKDAEEYRDERNQDIVDVVVSSAPEWANLKEKFNNTLKKYKELEASFEKNTKYLPTDDSKNRVQKLYAVDEENGIVDEGYSVYSLLDEDAYKDESYGVYTITEKEAKELEKILEDDAVADTFVPKLAKKYMHTPLMMHNHNNNFAKLISPDGKSSFVEFDKTPYISCIPFPLRDVDYDEEFFHEFFFTQETYDDIVEAYNLTRKRERTLELKLKPNDIWTNDRYKY